VAIVAFSAPTVPCGALVVVAGLRRLSGLIRESGEDDEEAVEAVDEEVEQVEDWVDKEEMSRRRLGPRPAAAASIMDIVEVLDVNVDVTGLLCLWPK
jgi:hypothetical protein